MKTDFPLELSVVVPLYNERESLKILYDRLASTLQSAGISYEVIFVDDGSNDGSWQEIKQLHADYPPVRAIRFARNNGKSAGLQVAFQRAVGRVVATMDADLQDAPEELPELYRMIVKEDYDLVSGWKRKRYDNKLTKNLPSKLFNAAARKVSGIHNLHDFNCGLKAYKNEVIKSIELYNDMHRYIPYLAKSKGYTKIGEKEVQHAKRQFGHSKYGFSRFYKGFLDLMVIGFIARFGRKPMYFFGTLGLLTFLVGFLALVVVLVTKFSALSRGVPAPLVTDRVYFFIALAAMIIGVQLFTAGFLGEMIAQQSLHRNDYIIKEEL